MAAMTKLENAGGRRGRAAAEQFHHNDPLYKAGIRQTTELRAFDKRVG